MRSIVPAAHLAMGLIVWSLWFVVVYASVSVVCAIAPPAIEAGVLNWLNAWLLVITLLTTALLVGAARHCWQRSPIKPTEQSQEWFMARMAAAIYFLSGVATLAVGLPALVLPPCL